jgi:hypothetical protein
MRRHSEDASGRGNPGGLTSGSTFMAGEAKPDSRPNSSTLSWTSIACLLHKAGAVSVRQTIG